MKANKNMLTALRKQANWTQSDLAGYLGVHRSLVSLTELGERTLPTEALIKATKLQQYLDSEKDPEPDEKTTALLARMEAEAAEELARLRKDADYELQKLKRELAEAEKLHEEALQTLKRLPLLRSYMEDEPAGIRNLIDLQEYKALKKLRIHPPKKLVQLRVRIRELEEGMKG
ncbi:helix-turn-helix domain-containing protein [Roseivirga sp. BDSF3-8]|uniref:helix-turn-helix domain-containing protein n=1 Tax=Roseivirga sp. BDSF3-8 TaxID=3241598 RepID=UPI0035327D33